MDYTDLQQRLNAAVERYDSQTFLGSFRDTTRSSLLNAGLSTRANSLWKMAEFVVAKKDAGSPDGASSGYLVGWRTLASNYNNQTLLLEVGDDEWEAYDAQGAKLGGEEYIKEILEKRSLEKRVGKSAAVMLDAFATWQLITYGAPGTGKSHRTKLETEGHTVYRTTFHPDSDYSTFVGAYKPTMRPEQRINCIDDKAKAVKDADGKPSMQDVISYDFVPQAFIKAYVDAWQKWADAEAEKAGGGGEKRAEPVFLVIEEINRGNCAQIFGDLFQLLDRDEEGYSEYAIDADADLARWLASQFDGAAGVRALPVDVASGKKLVLPPNLYIRATMNTSDQSLFPIDSAFKRRWEWKYVPIAKPTEAGWKDRAIVCKWKEKDSNDQDVDVAKAYDWWEFLKIANAQILETTKSEDKQLGYFFVKAPDATGHIKADRFAGKVLFYLYNDVFKDYSLPATLFGDGSGGSTKYEFKMFFDEYGETIEKVVAAFLDQLKVPSKPLAGADGDGTPSLPTTAV